MRTGPNYIYAILSVSLVLFLLGFFALVIFQGQELVKLAREQVEVIVELKEDTPQAIRNDLSHRLEKTRYVKAGSVKFVSKEAGALLMREEFGEEFILLDMPNPLYDVLTFNVLADYLQADSLARIRGVVLELNAVRDVFYQESIATEIAKNIKKFSYIALGLSMVLLFIAFVLIHNTIRLALYANRMLIKNMELAGAGWDFISRPYILRSAAHGFISGLLATSGLLLVIFTLHALLPESAQLTNWFNFGLLASTLCLIGIFISAFSTWFVVNKYLKMRVDEMN